MKKCDALLGKLFSKRDPIQWLIPVCLIMRKPSPPPPLACQDLAYIMYIS